MKEIWKDIYFEENGVLYDYVGLYQISNYGYIKNVKTNKITSGSKKDGYLRTVLTKNKKRKGFYIHRLVAHMFVPNPDNKSLVDHIIPVSNGGTNEASNLRWTTQKENIKNNTYTTENKRKANIGDKNPMYGKKGSKHHRSKKIECYDEFWNLLKTYGSSYEAQRNTGCAAGQIIQICKYYDNPNEYLKTHKWGAKSSKDKNGNKLYFKYHKEDE